MDLYTSYVTIVVIDPLSSKARASIFVLFGPSKITVAVDSNMFVDDSIHALFTCDVVDSSGGDTYIAF